MPCPICGSDVWAATGGCGTCSANSINAVKCNHCGKRIDKDADKDQWVCTSCGAAHDKYGKIIRKDGLV